MDRPTAFLAARLVDVFPDGRAERVSYGLANLTHDTGHTTATPVAAGPRRLTLQLNDVAHAFPAGHRLRVALSTAYWPLVWPSPEPVGLSVRADASQLVLPVRPPRPEDADLAPFDAPETASGPEVRDLHPGGVARTVERDAATGEVTVTTSCDLDARGAPAISVVEPIRLEVGYGIVETTRLRESDPLSAETETLHESVQRRDGWEVRVRSRHRVSSSRDAFRLEVELDAQEGGRAVFSRRWDERVPRRGL